MTLVKHNYKNLNNLFDEFFNTLPSTWGRDMNVPPVNISESPENYELELVAPGLKKEDFKVNLEKGMLTISYEKRSETEDKNNKIHRKEFSVSSFKRSFSVDDNIKADGIEAKYENGLLKITLPKKEEVKALPKEISIK